MLDTHASPISARTWSSEASCHGFSEIMMPPLEVMIRKEAREKAERQAKAICSVCPVREPCLNEALRNKEPLGVWGGLNPEERRTLRGR